MEQNYVLTRIREMLDQRNWSLYKLSQETGIPYSSLNSLFQKNNQPTISTLEKSVRGSIFPCRNFLRNTYPMSRSVILPMKR